LIPAVARAAPPIERRRIIEMMDTLELGGMRAAFEKIDSDAGPGPPCALQLVAELLEAEIAERRARSVRYQMARAHLPSTKELEDFSFAGTPIDENRVRSLAAGALRRSRRNILLVGARETGKTHLAVAIARNWIRSDARGRFEIASDLISRLEHEAHRGRTGDIADELVQLDFLVLDELGRQPLLRNQCLAQLLDRLIGRISLIVTTDQQASAWVSIFGDALAATLDWLNRQGEAIDTGNRSYRQTETT
jgi:DNA replication protein DnaC